MEITDNAVVLAVPGAMDAGLGDVLFWGSLAFALAVAFVAALPINRWLISGDSGTPRSTRITTDARARPPDG